MSLYIKDAIRRFGLDLISDCKAVVQDGVFVLPAAPGWDVLVLPAHGERRPTAADVQKREVVGWRLDREGDYWEQREILVPVPRTTGENDLGPDAHIAVSSPTGPIVSIAGPSRGSFADDAFPTVDAWLDAVAAHWTAWRKEYDAHLAKICPTCGRHRDEFPF